MENTKYFTQKLVIILMLLVCSVYMYAEEFEVGGILYRNYNNNNNVTILGKNKSYTGAIVIPETVSYQKIDYTVTSIYEYAFSGDKDITSIVIPPSITFIDEAAFYHCENLDTVFISSIESWCNIGFDWNDSNPLQYAKHLYINGKEVNDIVIPEGITVIDEYAFYNFQGIRSLTLPKSLTWIWKSAFADCYNLELVISKCDTPPSFDSDYGSPFIGISSKAKLLVPQGTLKKYLSLPKWSNYFAEIEELGNESSDIISFSDANVKEICIANWDTNNDGELSKMEAAVVTDIGQSFRKTSIEIFPEFKYFTGLTYIGDEAFEKCSWLKYIILPPNIKSIRHQAFKECGFTEFSVMDGVESIAYEAFQSCNNLKKILIPQSVKSISSLSFPHSITTITIDANNGTYECPTNSCCIIEKETKTLIFGTNISKIPAGTKSIGAAAFQSSSIIQVDMPNSVTKIGSSAFYGCSSLETLNMSNSVTEIGESAFYGCNSLSDVKLPNTVTSIGTKAFQYCSTISSITIPQNVTSLGASAFIGCSGLTTATVKCKIALPNQLFADCTQLEKVTLSDGIAAIGNNVFNGCSSLATIEIPVSVTSIGIGAFGNCSALASAFIPNSVESIGSSAFEGCTLLTRVVSKIQKPFAVNGVFVGIPYDSELYVPYGKKSVYETTNGWNVFGEIIESKPEQYGLNITVSGNGSINYDGRTIRNQSNNYTVAENTMVILSFVPDNGYRVASLNINSQDNLSQILDNKLEITITGETNVDVVFEETPPNTYALNISTTGNGSVVYGDAILRNESKSFIVEEGEEAIFSFTPDNDNKIKSICLNGNEISSAITNGQYCIEHVNADVTLEVIFSPVIRISESGVNYVVVSEDDQTLNVSKGDYGLLLTIPASLSADGKTWKVVDIEHNALNGISDLSAIIWNPEVKFNASVNNPNLLLFVKDKSYAPANIKNVIVNNNADEITLTDAASGNNFYCPQAFTAKSVTYEHNYSMKSGLKVCQGWETIVLPFDVTTITRESGETLVPYAAWSVGSGQRPFWLYSLTSDGWKAESCIKANTPYIICMPNNDFYDAAYNISGKVVFKASNVQIAASDNLPYGQQGNKKLIPNYQNQDSSSNIWALNVNNEYSKNTDSALEGSMFVNSLRNIHPFEAYMTMEGAGAVRRAIPVFDDNETTGIINIPLQQVINNDAWYTLEGRKLQSEPTNKGVYIKNGKKVVVK